MIKNTIILLIVLTCLSASSFAQPNPRSVVPQKHYVGIEGDEIDNIMVAQNNSYWCWAATIEMVLNYYKIYVPQDSIVKKVYGLDENSELPDYGASMETIQDRLNCSDVDTSGVSYTISSEMGKGAPNPAVLIRELGEKKPVIIGYDTGEGGHTVLITAASYINTPSGPKITSIVVRDPMPDAAFDMSNGRIEYPGRFLAQRIQAYWLIDVEVN